MSAKLAPTHDGLREEVLEGFFKLLILPLAKLLLRFQVDVHETTELLRRGYVEAAAEQTRRKGERATVSRVALLTGLRRPVVSKMLDSEPEALRPSDRVRLVGLWWSRWRNDGEVLDIPIQGAGRTFESLCAEVSTKYPARTVLNELVSSGNVELIDTNTVRLVDRKVASRDHVTRLIEGLLGTRRMLDTISHNIAAIDDPDKPENFQQIYFSRFIPSVRLPKLRAELRRLLQRFFNETQETVDAAEDDVRSLLEKETAGVGLFYFEEIKK